MLRRVAKLAGFGLLGLVLLGLAYEAYAVWRAHSRTAEIKADILARSQALSSDDLTADQLDILLKVEDPAFFLHNGLDLSSPGQGMTTITQGIVKYLYFDPFRPGLAKIEQSLIAWLVVDRRFTKEEQLRIMLNHAYLGSKDGTEVRGFEAGARAHFGSSLGELETEEYVGLVGMLIGPNGLDPARRPEAYAERVDRITRYLAGTCQPDAVFDPWLEGCAIVR